MQITSPPYQFNNSDLDNWLRELYFSLLSQPMSDIVPASSTDVGVKGQIAFDNDFIYICYDTNLWKRIALVAF